MPLRCECGLDFTIDHAMICKKGGFPILRHNEIRNLAADLLKEVCHDVAVEPLLRPLDGEHFDQHTANTSDYARADISARGVWRRGESIFRYPGILSERQVLSPPLFSYISYEIHESEKSGNMVKEYEKLSMVPSPHSSSHLQVVQVLKQHIL